MRQLSGSLAMLAAGLVLVDSTTLEAQSAPTGAQPQITPAQFFACYVRGTGTVYRIKEPNTPPDCTAPRPKHVPFDWTDGVQAVRSGDAAGGDLAGTYPNPSVAKLQGQPLSPSAPTATGQVLTWDGSAWAPVTPPVNPTATPEPINNTVVLRGDNGGFAAGPVSFGELRVGGISTFAGPVGIGTESPRTDLHVLRRISTGLDFSSAGTITFFPPDGFSWFHIDNGPAGGRPVGRLRISAGQEVGDREFVSVLEDGRVGIGTSTPASQLTVAGPIETTSGGIKFPDGTVQTTAGGIGVSDHGALTGLEDDDHRQYLLSDGVRASARGFAVVLDKGSVCPNGCNIPPVSGPGIRLLWYPYAVAFRAGMVHQTQWDEINLAFGSTGLGIDVTASGEASTALGGSTTASGLYATALGHGTNATGTGSTAMGDGTTASALHSTALGNLTTASGDGSTAMGGSTIASGIVSTAVGLFATASGDNSTAVGFHTTASGLLSTALGAYATTNSQHGSFVYGDASTYAGTESTVGATAPNQFVVRAAGGFYFRTSSDLSTGCDLPAGSGAFSCTSDRNRKENFQDENGEDVLQRLALLPIQSWNYKGQGAIVRHLGPTAQDFFAAFRLGEGETTISTVDADGVNLLAIQALERRTQDLAALRERVATLERENEQFRVELVALQLEITRLLARLEETVRNSQTTAAERVRQ